jgi:hypothetical protein
MKIEQKITKAEKKEKQMKKWQITLIIIGGSLVLLFAVGFVMCNFLF